MEITELKKKFLKEQEELGKRTGKYTNCKSLSIPKVCHFLSIKQDELHNNKYKGKYFLKEYSFFLLGFQKREMSFLLVLRRTFIFSLKGDYVPFCSSSIWSVPQKEIIFFQQSF